jgi:Family of unknown function (DUF6516)
MHLPQGLQLANCRGDPHIAQQRLLDAPINLRRFKIIEQILGRPSASNLESSHNHYQYVIMISLTRRDPSLDTLLDLHDQVLVIDAAGYWAKFVLRQVPATADKPHGLDYTLTMHGPDGERLVGFDNAHPVQTRQGRAPKVKNHKHRLRTVKPYDYTNAATLLEAFWNEVDR